ncbi:MAG: 2,3,4,5-tetrahydropyridine-2,6-dicarboxylate N-acetyltransferase [Ignavibacterium sp.]
MDSYEIIDFISNSPRKTPIKVYLKGKLNEINFSEVEFYGNEKFGVLFCEYSIFKEILSKHKDKINQFKIEIDRKNSAVPLADITQFNARIEPGAIIRDKVSIGDNCVIMMGAVINIGAVIGERTMIDMNVVVGGRAIIGSDCHIGAGAVIAGVIEPPSAEPVRIGNNVLVGANAVILEGVKVGNGSIIAAGSVVISDVEENTVVAGVPAKFIKKVDKKTEAKTQLIKELRKL